MMILKKRLFTFIIFSILHFHIQAQETVPLYLGTKTPYHPLQSKLTPLPAGFTPLFINYVGRHGARFLTKPGSDVLVADVLQQALAQNALTPTGKQVQQSLLQFVSAEKGNYENITLLGREEQKEIGERMYAEYRAFLKSKTIEIQTTTKVRTQQSAAAFLQSFPAEMKQKIHQQIIPDSMDITLRFYDLSPAYDEYEKSEFIQQHLDSLHNDKRMEETTNRVCRKLFADTFITQLENNKIAADNGSGKQKKVDAIAFTQALYDVYTIWFSLIKEVQNNSQKEPANELENAFEKEDLAWLDKTNSAEDFYAKGPAEDTMGIQVTIAVPLLVDFINTTDSVINNSKQTGAVLRFTHAEAISPFATLLGIPQASSESFSVYDFDKHWQSSNIIPLSANIQWILYSNGKQVLIKALLNEKEIRLPVATSTFPYYDWKEVRNYYVDKLRKINVSLQGDMKKYLMR